MNTDNEVTLRASVRVPSPFRRYDLDQFLATVPARASITIATFTQGQRDPENASYAFVAEWNPEEA